MCGISGFIGKGDFSDLKRMNDVIAHRGPDDDGFLKDEVAGVYLGHRRLSIVDISGGHQPMYSADGEIAIVFNGEIYNHEEIRHELIRKGYAFASNHSDTETLIYAYKEWGLDMLEKLNGMWAFAIYDKRKKQIVLSRDRFGKKPLFYSLQNGTFAFASELHSLKQHSKIQVNLSTKGLRKYFAYGYIPAPHTIYEACYKMPGGHSLVLNVDTLQFSIKQYWEFKIEPFTSIPADPVKTWGEELIDLIDKAVKRRLMSDVPLGFFLSGGIDSSTVVAMASRYLKGNQLKTFSIGFTEASFDESAYAKSIAEQFQTEHHTETLSLDMARELIPYIVGKLDEPMGDSSLLPSYLLCRETRKHVTVALGGDGADELFCGYDPFRALNKAKLYKQMIPAPIHKGILMLAATMPVSHRNMSLDFKIKRTLRGLSHPANLWNAVWMGPLAPHELADLFEEKIHPEEIYEEAIRAWESCQQPSYMDKATEFYVKLYLQDDILVKVDRASMMNSLEVRAPFLDIELVNFVRKIPVQYKFRNGETKYLLKKALEPILPKEILYRSKKGFGVPIGKWFSEKKLNVEKSGIKGISTAFIDHQIKQHSLGKQDNRAFLWNYWLLEQWSKKTPVCNPPVLK